MDLNQIALAVATQIKTCQWNNEDLFYQVKANYHHQLLDFARNLVINALALNDPHHQVVSHYEQQLTYQGQTHQILLFVDHCQEATKFLFPTKTKKIKNWFVILLSPNEVQLRQASYQQVFHLKSAKQWLKSKSTNYQNPNWNQFRDHFYQWFNHLHPVFVKQHLLNPPQSVLIEAKSESQSNDNLVTIDYSTTNVDFNKSNPDDVQSDQTLNAADQAMSNQLGQIVYQQVSQGVENDN